MTGLRITRMESRNDFQAIEYALNFSLSSSFSVNSVSSVVKTHTAMLATLNPPQFVGLQSNQLSEEPH